MLVGNIGYGSYLMLGIQSAIFSGLGNRYQRWLRIMYIPFPDQAIGNPRWRYLAMLICRNREEPATGKGFRSGRLIIIDVRRICA